MNSILNAIRLTARYREASSRDAARRRLPEPISSSCRELLDEARKLGLDLDDVIDAVRRTSATTTRSN
jgi:hypothetical protein